MMTSPDSLAVHYRQQARQAQTITIKVGSALITDLQQGLNLDRMSTWCEQIANILQKGQQVVLVSSGAVAQGIHRLGWDQRPRGVGRLQAAAAVGQAGLMHAYETLFARYGITTAQILLTHQDMFYRKRYIHAQHTLKRLMSIGVCPIINENDTVAIEEILFGDNDSLAAVTAIMTASDSLIILSDQAGLLEEDPRQNPHANLIKSAEVHSTSLDKVACGSSVQGPGRGGMITKLTAARIAARCGINTFIADGREPDVITRLIAGENLGTLLYNHFPTLPARKRWIASHSEAQGQLVLDNGAVEQLLHGGGSVLPAGVVEVSGKFNQGQLVSCQNTEQQQIAFGLVSCDTDEAKQLIAASSGRTANKPKHHPLIHRDNLIVFKPNPPV